MTMACPLPPVGATVSSGSSALGSRNLGARRRAASDSAGISAMVIDVTVKVKLDPLPNILPSKFEAKILKLLPAVSGKFTVPLAALNNAASKVLGAPKPKNHCWAGYPSCLESRGQDRADAVAQSNSVGTFSYNDQVTEVFST